MLISYLAFCIFVHTGVIRFTQAVKVYEKQDQDIAQMNSQLRAILIPPVRLQAHSNGS